MKLFTRPSLIPADLPIGAEALLLEGTWPAHQRSLTHWSLDEAIDARHAWIDDEAARLAESLCEQGTANPWRDLAWRNAVRLRYFLVKLLRVVAFLTERSPLAGPAKFELYFNPERDAFYRELLASIAANRGIALTERPVNGAQPAAIPAAARHEPAWRRLLGRVVAMLDRRPGGEGPRVVLCGNPRLLEPVCEELAQRRIATWWLGERFAPRTWARWRPQGVGFRTCDSALPLHTGGRAASGTLPTHIELPPSPAVPPVDLACRGVDLGPAVRAWLTGVQQECDSGQCSQRDAIDALFRRLRPTHVLLDQDGTPLNRMLVAAARNHGARTGIVQHGTPYVRFGFAPLEADRMFAWGETSRRQFLEWEIDGQKIVVTGSTQPPLASPREEAPSNPPRFLLLATLAPRDERPDVVSYHLTRDTFVGMVRMACEAVARIPGAQLDVKLHPRDLQSSVVRAIVDEFPQLSPRVLAAVSLERSLSGIDCVLSCTSSAGVEAAAWGWPVVQLMPEGSRDLLPAESWSLIGSTSDADELARLIDRALARPRRGEIANPQILAASGSDAAKNIVDAFIDSNQEPSSAPTSRNRSSLLRDAVRVGSSTIVCQMLAVITSLWLRHVIDPTRMGIWQALKLFLGYSNYANLGISKGAAREWSAAHGSGQLAAARRGLNLAFTVNTLASLACALALLAGAAWLWSSGDAESSPAWTLGLVTLAVVVVLQRHVSYQVTLLRAGRDFRSTSRLSMLEGGLTLLLGGACAWCWGVYGLYAATILVLVASWIYLIWCGAPQLRWAWNGPEIRRLIAIGGPIVLAGAATTLFRSLDKLTILCCFADAEFQLGCYSLALLVGAQLYGLANMLAIVVAPRMAERFGATACRQQVARFAAGTSYAQALLLGLSGAMAIVVAPPILTRWFPDYSPGIAPLTWIILGAVALGMSLPASQYLVAVGRERFNLVLIVAATAFTALGNGVAVAARGGTSAVAASMALGNAAYALALVAAVLKHLPRHDRLRSAMVHVLTLAPPLGLAIALESHWPPGEAWMAVTGVKLLAIVGTWAVLATITWAIRPGKTHPAAHLAWPEFIARCQKPDHRRIGNWFARRVSRPLALHVTWVILPTGISAHAVTLVAWACGLFAVIALGIGGPLAVLGGVALLQLWYLLDHVDGQIARWRDQQSLDGVALDYMMHHTLNLLVPLGVGYGLARAMGSDAWWLVGTGWGLGLLLLGLDHDVRAKALVQRLKRLHGRLEVEGGGGGRPAPQPQAPQSLTRRCVWVARKACEIHVVMNALTLLAIVDCAAGFGSRLVAGYAAAMAPLAVAVAGLSLARRVRGEAAEQEFAAWYRVPEGRMLIASEGNWHVIDIDESEADVLHSSEFRQSAGSS